MPLPVRILSTSLLTAIKLVDIMQPELPAFSLSTPQTRVMLDCVSNVMAHAQKPDFVFRLNGRVHLNRQGRQFSRLLAAEVCGSAVVMLDTTCSEVAWRVLATHSIPQFPFTSSPVRHRMPSHFSWTLPSNCVKRKIWNLQYYNTIQG